MTKRFISVFLALLMLFGALSAGITAHAAPSKGWHKKDGYYYYYYDSKGHYYKNTVEKVAKKYYAFDKKGRLVTKMGWNNYVVVEDEEDSYYEYRYYYYVKSDTSLQTGWLKIKGKWYHFNPIAARGKRKIGKKQYMFGKDCALVTKGGFYSAAKRDLTDGEILRYYDCDYDDEEDRYAEILTFWVNSSGVVTAGWKKISGKKYYFEKSDRFLNYGEMYKNGVYRIAKKYYLFNAKGVYVSGKGFHKISGNTYCVNADGYALTGYKKYGGYYYFFSRYSYDGLGKMYTDRVEYVQSRDKYYAFGSNGRQITAEGWIVSYDEYGDEETFYVTSDCSLATESVKIGEHWYLFGGSGCYIGDEGVQGLYHSEADRSYYALYYVNENGWLDHGWIEKTSWTYYAGEDGRFVTGLTEIDGKLYYFDKESDINYTWGNHMLTGMVKVNGSRYYFDPYMITNIYKVYDAVGYVDGCYNIYYFGSDGKGYLQKNKTVTVNGIMYECDENGIARRIDVA